MNPRETLSKLLNEIPFTDHSYFERFDPAKLTDLKVNDLSPELPKKNYYTFFIKYRLPDLSFGLSLMNKGISLPETILLQHIISVPLEPAVAIAPGKYFVNGIRTDETSFARHKLRETTKTLSESHVVQGKFEDRVGNILLGLRLAQEADQIDSADKLDKIATELGLQIDYHYLHQGLLDILIPENLQQIRQHLETEDGFFEQISLWLVECTKRQIQAGHLNPPPVPFPPQPQFLPPIEAIPFIYQAHLSFIRGLPNWIRPGQEYKNGDIRQLTEGLIGSVSTVNLADQVIFAFLREQTPDYVDPDWPLTEWFNHTPLAAEKKVRALTVIFPLIKEMRSQLDLFQQNPALLRKIEEKPKPNNKKK